MEVNKNQKLSWIESLAVNYFHKKALKKIVTVDEFHIMNSQEQKTIKRVTLIAVILSAIYGVMGVIVLYLPIYNFPNFFFDYKFYF